MEQCFVCNKPITYQSFEIESKYIPELKELRVVCTHFKCMKLSEKKSKLEKDLLATDGKYLN